MEAAELNNQLLEIAYRIREMREISGFTGMRWRGVVDLSLQEYTDYEAQSGFSVYVHPQMRACVWHRHYRPARGHSAKLSSYTVTRRARGKWRPRGRIEISSLAPMFRNKIAEPYWVKYDTRDAAEPPVHLTTHNGQDSTWSQRLAQGKVGEHTRCCEECDSIYYNSATPHGMNAVGGKECLFVAVVLPARAREHGGTAHEHRGGETVRGLRLQPFRQAARDEKA